MTRLGLVAFALAPLAFGILVSEPSQAQVSTICQFTSGPLAGARRDYAPAPPVPVGTPCHDGSTSTGTVVAGGSSTPHPAAAGALRVPFSGTWGALQAPPCPFPTNHHCGTANQLYAYDFVMLGPNGAPVSCIGQPVVSPSAGRVIAAQDGLPNNAVPGMHPAGNHIVIERGPGQFILLAHFSPGTIQVVQGQRIQAGQPLGACGNSGISSFPHIHMHMQSDPNVLNFGSPGAPMMFDSVNIWSPAAGCQSRVNYVIQRNDVVC
jgi:hypothetical protein